jgi:hypothetical protein
MRRHFFQSICWATLTIAAPAWAAGVKMQSEMTDLASGTVTKMDILLDQTRLRVNVASAKNSSSILFLTDGGRDRLVMLDTAKNEYTEIDKTMMDRMAQQMSGAMSQMQGMMDKMSPEQRAMMERMMKGKMPTPAAAPQKTVYASKGGSNVNGFACTKYEGTRGGQKVTEVCAAAPTALRFTPADFQVFDRMREFTASITQMAANSPFAGAAMDYASFTDPGYNGIPVSQTSYSGGKAVSKTDVKSIQAASFSNADFSLGSAKKRDMPGMPK